MFSSCVAGGRRLTWMKFLICNVLVTVVGLVFQVAMVTKSSASTDRSSDKKTLPSHPLLGR